MRPTRTTRSLSLLLPAAAVAVLAAGLATGPGATRSARPDSGLALAHGVPGTDHPPINTAKQYRWGNATWHDGFVGPLVAGWRRTDRAPVIQNQHGQLTLNGPGGTSGHTLQARFTQDTRQYGRWDFSVRSRQYETGHRPYTAVVELTPADPSRYHCGGQNIVVTKFPLGGSMVTSALRNAGQRFVATNPHAVSSNEFHTYALEVTRDRISWFMEGKVLMTERRPAALSGDRFQVSVRLVPPRAGVRTNKGRVQLDWARYYTLARKNAKSVAAPHAQQYRFGAYC